MSWMTKLYETYQQGLKLDLPEDKKLTPVSHTKQNAHINIVIDGDGNFKRANVLEKKSIILPATEQSAGRTSGCAPHPLADKLQYVAHDYLQYGGIKQSYFKSYQALLLDWCRSEFCHPKAWAVYKYISKGKVVEDLINAKIVYVDKDKKLLTSWPPEATEEEPTPLLFKVLPKDKGKFDQGNAFVCWTVEIVSDPNSDTWSDETLENNWINYEASLESIEGLCYVSGSSSALAINHPAKIRHTGDKAKLISSNDKSGYTYRGKFSDATEALGISFESTQKAHNALRWLIGRQGHHNGDQRIIAWAVSGKSIPEPLIDSYSFLKSGDLDEIESLDEESVKLNHGSDLGQSFAIKLNKKMAGYRSELGDYESVMIMAIDSATPGRMGIIYYRECMSKEFIDLIESWHLDFAWYQRYSKDLPQPNGKKPIKKTIWPISAPVPKVIAEAAYGKSLTDMLKRNLYERLMPCILEGRPLPVDILNSCIHKASNPHTCERWEWERNVGVACALYRGFYRRHLIQTKRRDYSMSLETNYTSRDYLYGRLLAIADRIEELALNIAGEKRNTTAERLMQRFADRPFTTWRNIELALRPYIDRLKTKRIGFLTKRLKELDEVMNLFEPCEFANDKKLSGEFLLGYHCQRQELLNQAKFKNIEEVQS